MDALETKIVSKAARVAVVGLGYAGLPLAVEFARAGFKVHGIDTDCRKVEQLRRGVSHVPDVPERDLKEAVRSKHLEVHCEYDVVSQVDCISICVPTPLSKTRDPDMSYIVSAAGRIREFIHKDMLVVLESTTYPGTTEEVLAKELESGLEIGRDIYLAFSPERVDPGNREYNTRNTPKIVGGITPACTRMAKLFYEQAVDQVVSVSSAAAAEMVKLLENTFRAVNIGLVNEIAIMCDRLGVPVWEVIEAAATKPFGFMPFFPGPGLGGHCIPVDPLYLSWKLRLLNYNARFIQLANEVNTHMPAYCVEKIRQLLNQKQKCVNGAHILVLGVAYKRDTGDVRESPALDIIQLLEKEGAKIEYSDPFVPELRHNGTWLKSVPVSPEKLKACDLAILATDHSAFDYSLIQGSAPLIFDSRNAFRRSSENLVKL